MLRSASLCLQLMTVIGNDNANKFWEWHLSPENKINTEADESVLNMPLFVHVSCTIVQLAEIFNDH